MDTPMELSDAHLIGRLVNGDGEAARPLIERYRRPLFALLRRALGSAAEADDAFQNVWLRVVRAASRYDPLQPFDRWLFAIAWNVVRDEWRRGARRRHDEELSENLVDDRHADAEAVALHGDRIRQVRSAVRDLPERMAEVLLLRYFEELSEAECAARLDVPLGTVKRRAHLGLKRLREALNGGSNGKS